MNLRHPIRAFFSGSFEVVLLATAAGLYVSIFYIAGNATMLPPKGMLIVALALTLPIVLASVVAIGFSKLLRLRQYGNLVALLVILIFVFSTLSAPVISIHAVTDFQGQLSGPWSILFYFFVFVVPAILVAMIFRRSIPKLTIIFCVMSLAAVLMNVAERFRGVDSLPNSSEWQNDVASLAVKLDRRPNIYLIVPDSFGSTTYLQELGIDVSGLKAGLKVQGFRFYDDAFSNYHPTLPSMLSTLNMAHHFYQSTVKESEVVAHGRKSIGGDNTLLRVLANNGYESEYIHASNYLLLQGCSADVCYPEPRALEAAAKLLQKITPFMNVARMRGSGKAVRGVPLANVHDRLQKSLHATRASGIPHFTYVHIFEPGHPSTAVRGRCDEAYELRAYSRDVGTASAYLRDIINEIVETDPAAVIVLAGDHGPWIKNNCETVADLGSVTQYRDRMSALLAIRWPQGYSGKYDDTIKTPINIFRYILAELADSDEQLLATVQSEDAFIQATNGFAQILADGEIVGPPQRNLGQ